MPDDAIVIRPFRDQDADQVVAIWRASGVSRSWNDPLRDIAFARRGGHSALLVAARQDRVAATAMVGEDGHRGWVYYVAADPELKGTGLGRAMMDAAEQWLVARGVWKMQLLVREENEAAKGFYEHLGYHDARTTCFQKEIGPPPD